MPDYQTNLIYDGIREYRANEDERDALVGAAQSKLKMFAKDPGFLDTFGEQAAKMPTMSTGALKGLVAGLSAFEHKKDVEMRQRVQEAQLKQYADMGANRVRDDARMADNDAAVTGFATDLARYQKPYQPGTGMAPLRGYSLPEAANLALERHPRAFGNPQIDNSLASFARLQPKPAVDFTPPEGAVLRSISSTGARTYEMPQSNGGQLAEPSAKMVNVAGWNVPAFQRSPGQWTYAFELATNESGQRNPRWDRTDNASTSAILRSLDYELASLNKVPPSRRTPADIARIAEIQLARKQFMSPQEAAKSEDVEYEVGADGKLRLKQ